MSNTNPTTTETPTVHLDDLVPDAIRIEIHELADQVERIADASEAMLHRAAELAGEWGSSSPAERQILTECDAAGLVLGVEAEDGLGNWFSAVTGTLRLNAAMARLHELSDPDSVEILERVNLERAEERAAERATAEREQAEQDEKDQFDAEIGGPVVMDAPR